MRQPVFPGTLLTLIAVLYRQHAGPARATLDGKTLVKPAAVDKATQTDSVSFKATRPLESAHAPMGDQSTSAATSDIKQKKAARPTASVTARPIASGSQKRAEAKQKKKASGGTARKGSGKKPPEGTTDSARPAEVQRAAELVQDVVPAADGTEQDDEDKISINTALLDDLVDGLKGIGPKKGPAIIN